MVGAEYRRNVVLIWSIKQKRWEWQIDYSRALFAIQTRIGMYLK